MYSWPQTPEATHPEGRVPYSLEPNPNPKWGGSRELGEGRLTPSYESKKFIKFFQI